MKLKKFSVYISRKLPDSAIQMLSKECNVILNEKERPSTRKELLNGVQGKDAILCTLLDNIDAKVIDSAGVNLKVISSYSTGVDHIDVEEATKRGISVTSTGDILTETTADLTFALILAIARRITQGYEAIIHKRWKYGWDPCLMLGSDVHGKVIGILGLGKIGSAVARRAKGFDMDIIYHNRHGRKIQNEKQVGAKYVSLEELVQRSDFLSLHCPLNNENYHVINRSIFKLMKSDAYLINTARGPLVSEAHLIEALEKKWIAGAGLDVLEKEPPSLNNKLLKMKNVVLLPHMGSATISTRIKMAEIAAKNILNVLDNKTPVYITNPQVHQR